MVVFNSQRKIIIINAKMNKPLAYRMRPKTIDEVIGQEKLVGPDGFFRNCLKNKVIISCILYGPPGTGKTTIAEAFANSINVHYIMLNATTSGKSDLLEAFKEAALYPDTILIVDEIHRLNKDKQDLLLPRLEDGSIYLIGMTTENPMLAINPAIRSRTHLLEVKPLTVKEIETGIRRAIVSLQGLNDERKFTDDAISLIAKACGGDLRYAYNMLEAASLTFSKNHAIDEEDIRHISSLPNFYADKDGNEHYDTVSAFQKSIRGSEVDAAIYYLAKLCQSGDLEGLIRRLLVTAYEDIGLANPQAVDRCYNACQVAREVGFPEAIIPLGFTVVDLALSPKSKSSCLAIEDAMSKVDDHPTQVRSYLKYTPVDVPLEDRYPYDRPDLWKYLEYMPEGMENVHFYKPELTGNYEKNIYKYYEELKNLRRSTSIHDLKTRKDK